MNTMTYNQKLITSIYHDTGLKADVRSGFAIVEQKTNLVKLKLLVATAIGDSVFPQGSSVYVDEHSIKTQPWGKAIKKADFVSEPFLVIDFSQVIAVQLPET